MQRRTKLALELASRLERISVDSYWAHRASGLRVALLRLVERLDVSSKQLNQEDFDYMDSLIEQGYVILVNAAKELRGKSS